MVKSSDVAIVVKCFFVLVDIGKEGVDVRFAGGVKLLDLETDWVILLAVFVFEFEVDKLVLTGGVPSDEMRDAVDVLVEVFVDSDVMAEEGAVYEGVSVLSDDFETLVEVV